MIQVAAFLALPAVSVLIAALARLEAAIESEQDRPLRAAFARHHAYRVRAAQPQVVLPQPAQVAVPDVVGARELVAAREVTAAREVADVLREPAAVRALQPSAGA